MKKLFLFSVLAVSLSSLIGCASSQCTKCGGAAKKTSCCQSQ